MNKSILITGANAGIGKETARQLALISGTEKIYLACRNKDRAHQAKADLEKSTGKSLFEIIIMDVSNIESVKATVDSLSEPIDALIMNAGGMGGKTPNAKTKYGVTQIVAVNVLGHIVLLDELLKANKLNKVALFAGSEAARGIKVMAIKKPALKTSSVDEFTAICNGSLFKENANAMVSYGYVKYIGTMSLMSTARKNTNIRILSMSPGGTIGTEVASDMPASMKFMFKVLGPTIMPLMGMMHKLEVGAKRFVDGITDESYKSGVFYASKSAKPSGVVSNQNIYFKDLDNQVFQDNANEAIHRFIDNYS